MEAIQGTGSLFGRLGMTGVAEEKFVNWLADGWNDGVFDERKADCFVERLLSSLQTHTCREEPSYEVSCAPVGSAGT